jgi:hypothetical protein
MTTQCQKAPPSLYVFYELHLALKQFQVPGAKLCRPNRFRSLFPAVAAASMDWLIGHG